MYKWLVFLSLTFIGAACAGELAGLTPDELESMQKKGALVVDVRTSQEWKTTGLISGSQGLAYFDANGLYDKEGWLKQLKNLLKTPTQPVVLVCRSGNRSATVGKMMLTEAGYSKVWHLEKGIRAWSAESRPLTPWTENGAR